jgi:hypothetical protein
VYIDVCNDSSWQSSYWYMIVNLNHLKKDSNLFLSRKESCDAIWRHSRHHSCHMTSFMWIQKLWRHSCEYKSYDVNHVNTKVITPSRRENEKKKFWNLFMENLFLKIIIKKKFNGLKYIFENLWHNVFQSQKNKNWTPKCVG